MSVWELQGTMTHFQVKMLIGLSRGSGSDETRSPYNCRVPPLLGPSTVAAVVTTIFNNPSVLV